MASTNFQMNTTLGQLSPLMEQGMDPYSDNYGLLPGFWYTLQAGEAEGPVIDSIAKAAQLRKGLLPISLVGKRTMPNSRNSLNVMLKHCKPRERGKRLRKVGCNHERKQYSLEGFYIL